MAKCLFASLFVSLLCSVVCISGDTSVNNGDSEYFLFVGNPGVGKSKIINSLFGYKVAESGVSPGVGLTTFLSTYQHDNGKYFIDTPGLADVKLREQAAKEIATALKKDGIYRIFFVITLEALRVKPEDVASINTILDGLSINTKNKFSVIVNKLNQKEKNRLFSDTDAMATIYCQLNAGKHTTESFYYIENDRDLDEDEENLIPITSNLSEFIYEKSSFIRINPENVNKIITDEYEQIKQGFETTLKTLSEEIKRGEEKHDELKSEIKKLQTDLSESQRILNEEKNKPKPVTTVVEKVVEKEIIIRESGGCTIL